MSFPSWCSWLLLTPSSCFSSSERCHKSTVWCAQSFFFCYFLDYGLHHHCHCNYIVTVMYLCPLNAFSTSSLHIVSSILAHWQLVLGFVKPSPPGPTVQLWLSPTVLRNLVSRESNDVLIDSPSFPTDDTKLIKRDFASSVYSLLVWWTTWRSCVRENTK